MYDEGKRYAETLTTTFRKFHGLSTRIVRIFNTYGPRMDPDDGRVVSNFLCQALRGEPLTIYGDGQQTRSFQYVDDLVEGMRRMMEVEYLLPINLGMPEEFSIAELVELIGELLGRPVTAAYHPLPGDDPKQRRPDITLARQILGWQPKVPLAEGLRRTLQYFEACLEAACASDSRALGVPPGIEPRMPG